MASIESNINYMLNKAPIVKKVVKRCYQLVMYAISPKIKSEGNIIRISPDDGMEYFFGYYDKSPWDISDRYMLCIRVKNSYKSVAPNEPAEIVLFDTKNNNSYEVLATTNAWNVQQGCMLQWLGPEYNEKIIYNDFRDNRYCSVILNIKTKEEKIIDMPVYSVSEDGSFALTLDFSRLHRLRKGYGYSNIEEVTRNEKCPDKYAIWYVDLINNKVKPLMKYTDFKNFETRKEMIDAEHKVNHIMLNKYGNRFMVLHRWYKGSRKYTRLVTVNIDGSEMYNLNDDDMTSHCYWKSNNEIVAYARKKDQGSGYYIMNDKSSNYKKIWSELQSDGHPSYSNDGNIAITDSYPNRARISSVYCIRKNKIYKLAKVFSPFRYDNDVRCDLHPRLNREANTICFDSTHDGKRNLYVINCK